MLGQLSTPSSATGASDVNLYVSGKELIELGEGKRVEGSLLIQAKALLLPESLVLAVTEEVNRITRERGEEKVNVLLPKWAINDLCENRTLYSQIDGMGISVDIAMRSIQKIQRNQYDHLPITDAGMYAAKQEGKERGAEEKCALDMFPGISDAEREVIAGIFNSLKN